MAAKRREGGVKALNEMERYGLLALLAFLVLAIGYLLETLVAPAAPRLSIEPAGNTANAGQESPLASAPAVAASRTELLASAVQRGSSRPLRITSSGKEVAPSEGSRTRSPPAAPQQASSAKRAEFDFFEAPVDLPGHPKRPEFRSSSFRSVRIADGDTLEKLARRELGDARLWRAILNSNPGITPGRLRAGDELRIPVRDGSSAEAVVAATKTHEVRRGDSLESIALRYYGNRSRWVEILDANRDRIKSPRELRPGMALRIP